MVRACARQRVEQRALGRFGKIQTHQEDAATDGHAGGAAAVANAFEQAQRRVDDGQAGGVLAALEVHRHPAREMACAGLVSIGRKALQRLGGQRIGLAQSPHPAERIGLGDQGAGASRRAERIAGQKLVDPANRLGRVVVLQAHLCEL